MPLVYLARLLPCQRMVATIAVAAVVGADVRAVCWATTGGVEVDTLDSVVVGAADDTVVVGLCHVHLPLPRHADTRTDELGPPSATETLPDPITPSAEAYDTSNLVVAQHDQESHGCSDYS